MCSSSSSEWPGFVLLQPRNDTQVLLVELSQKAAIVLLYERSVEHGSQAAGKRTNPISIGAAHHDQKPFGRYDLREFPLAVVACLVEDPVSGRASVGRLQAMDGGLEQATELTQ